MINSGCALSAEGLKYLTRSPGNYASSLRWTLWCSNSIFLSHTDESSKDETRVCGCYYVTVKSYYNSKILLDLNK